MITFERLACHPAAFRSLSNLSSLSLTDFEALYQDFAVAYAKDRQASKTGKTGRRQRPASDGSGLAARLPDLTKTFEALAFFSLRKGNVQKGIVDVLATLAAHTIFVCETLAAHTIFVCERPATPRKKLRSVQAVMDAFPDVRLVIDAKEQRIQRP